MGLNVLSLFDGMSCGMIALERAGIEVDNYFASEIDKHAIKVSEDNYPDIIRIGDVTKVQYKDGTLYYEGGCIVVDIDLLIGGSPCQDFSIANTMNVQFDDETIGLAGKKSSLFYHWLRIRNEILHYNSNLYFLLENVKMRKSCKEELDKYLGTEGVCINSNLVSYQNRNRYYWGNLPIVQPEDRGISFQNYKEHDPNVLVDYKVKRTKSREKMWSNGAGRNSASFGCANVTNADKVQCLTTKQDRCPNSGLVEYEDFCRYLTRGELEQAQTVPIGYTDCLSYGQASKVLGNGWTVDVIAHIFQGLKGEPLDEQMIHVLDYEDVEEI